MTASFWNKQQIQSAFAACRSLAAIILQLEGELAPKGEVICEVRINGIKLTEEDERRYASMNLSEIDNLVVYSSSPSDLVQQAMASALDYIPHLSRGCERASQHFRLFQLEEGRLLFADLTEGLHWLHDTVLHLRGTWSGLGSYQANDSEWVRNEKIVQQVLRQMISAFEKTDYVLLADVLEFDLPNALQEWQRLLQDVIAQETGVKSEWTSGRSA